MIVLTTETTSQSFVVCPRLSENITFNANKIYLTDEETNTTEIINISSYSNYGYYYHTVSALFELTEGKTYLMKMCHTDLTDIRWVGKVFCTDQIDATQGFADVEGYSVNDGKYTTNTRTNEYIIL